MQRLLFLQFPRILRIQHHSAHERKYQIPCLVVFAYLRIGLRIEEKKWIDAMTILTREDAVITFIVE